MTSKDEVEIALRIQKRILAETRQKLKKTQEALKDNKKQIEFLDQEFFSMKAKIAFLIKEKEAILAEKDQVIEMLQRRVNSVNEEYNALNRSARSTYYVPPKPETPNPPKLETLRRHTTLEDVYKLTGEI